MPDTPKSFEEWWKTTGELIAHSVSWRDFARRCWHDSRASLTPQTAAVPARQDAAPDGKKCAYCGEVRELPKESPHGEKICAECHQGVHGILGAQTAVGEGKLPGTSALYVPKAQYDAKITELEAQRDEANRKLGISIGRQESFKKRCQAAEAKLAPSAGFKEEELKKLDGCSLIAAERDRHEAYGWDAEHDDEHDLGEIAIAASAYAVHSANLTRGHKTPMPPQWPWDKKWWKPSPEPVRNLVKSGALIAAEIDRLLRSQESGQAGKGRGKVRLPIDKEFLEKAKAEGMPMYRVQVDWRFVPKDKRTLLSHESCGYTTIERARQLMRISLEQFVQDAPSEDKRAGE